MQTEASGQGLGSFSEKPDYIKSCCLFYTQHQCCQGSTFTGFKTGSAKNVLSLFHAQDSLWRLSRTIVRTFHLDGIQSMYIAPLEVPEDQLHTDEPQHIDSDDSAVQGSTQTADGMQSINTTSPREL